MYAGLSRINKYFTPEMTDELNASFRQIDSKIENYKATTLDPLLTLSSAPKVTSDYTLVDRSFKAGNLLILSLSITIDEELDISSKTQIASLSLPYMVISQACLTSNCSPVRLIIENGAVSVLGGVVSAGDTINIYEELPLI